MGGNEKRRERQREREPHQLFLYRLPFHCCAQATYNTYWLSHLSLTTIHQHTIPITIATTTIITAFTTSWQQCSCYYAIQSFASEQEIESESRPWKIQLSIQGTLHSSPLSRCERVYEREIDVITKRKKAFNINQYGNQTVIKFSPSLSMAFHFVYGPNSQIEMRAFIERKAKAKGIKCEMNVL